MIVVLFLGFLFLFFTSFFFNDEVDELISFNHSIFTSDNRVFILGKGFVPGLEIIEGDHTISLGINCVEKIPDLIGGVEVPDIVNWLRWWHNRREESSNVAHGLYKLINGETIEIILDIAEELLIEGSNELVVVDNFVAITVDGIEEILEAFYISEGLNVEVLEANNWVWLLSLSH